MSEPESLTGSEQMVVILAGVAFAATCTAACMQFILRSRCTRIRCCYCAECERDVVSREAATTLDTSQLQSVGSLH